MAINWETHLARVVDRLGEVASWTPSSSEREVQVTGIFTDAPAEVALGLAGMVVSRPRFDCMASQVPGVKEGDRLELRGEIYTIAEPPKKNPVTGLVELALKKA